MVRYWSIRRLERKNPIRWTAADHSNTDLHSYLLCKRGRQWRRKCSTLALESLQKCASLSVFTCVSLISILQFFNGCEKAMFILVKVIKTIFIKNIRRNLSVYIRAFYSYRTHLLPGVIKRPYKTPSILIARTIIVGKRTSSFVVALMDLTGGPKQGSILLLRIWKENRYSVCRITVRALRRKFSK